MVYYIGLPGPVVVHITNYTEGKDVIGSYPSVNGAFVDKVTTRAFVEQGVSANKQDIVFVFKVTT